MRVQFFGTYVVHAVRSCTSMNAYIFSKVGTGLCFTTIVQFVERDRAPVHAVE